MAGPEVLRIGDYLVFPAFAQGGAASVHIARLVRSGGFRRLVVVKRLHAHVAAEPHAAERLLREAQLSSRVQSPYVVSTLDVIHKEGNKPELALVMDLVRGVTLGRLLSLARERNVLLAPGVAVALVSNVLRGLHAAHEATTEDGKPLDLLHRDIAPQNVMVGADGLARVVDFEGSRALGHHGVTASGEVRGTLGYMAPEQLRGGRPVTRQADVYASGVLLFECLTGKRLRTDALAEILASLDKPPPLPSTVRADLPKALDAIVLRALKVDPGARYPSAEAMATELEQALVPAPPFEVGRIVEKLAFDDLERMRELVSECERFQLSMLVDTPEDPGDVDPESVVGSIINGKYRVEGVLGRGGMGVVVEARHMALGESVAIKLLKAEDRVLKEARASLRIKSEHVVRVFDVGVDKGTAYLVMEKLDGTDLRALIQRGAVPMRDAVLYVLQACEVLAEAHGLGIVHRDLKPANLFLTRRPDGTPFLKVLDFGIAKATTDASTLTETNSMLGSPAYMSPEQLRSAKHVDERTDIWALGVVLYELLARSHPFADDDGTVPIGRIIADPPAPLRKRRPDVPDGLQQTIERCLAKDPDRRMASIGDLAAALEPFAPEGQVSTERIKRLTGIRSPSRAKGPRTALILSGATVVAIGVALTGAFKSKDEPRPQPPTRAVPEPIAEAPRIDAPPPVATTPVANDAPIGSTAASPPRPPKVSTGARTSANHPRPTPHPAKTEVESAPVVTPPPTPPPLIPSPALSTKPPRKKDPLAEFE